MRVLLIRSQLGRMQPGPPANVTHHEHVRIIPMARATVGLPLVLAEALAAHGRPGIPDVAGGAPAIGPVAQVRNIGKGHTVGQTQDYIPATGE